MRGIWKESGTFPCAIRRWYNSRKPTFVCSSINALCIPLIRVGSAYSLIRSTQQDGFQISHMQRPVVRYCVFHANCPFWARFARFYYRKDISKGKWSSIKPSVKFTISCLSEIISGTQCNQHDWLWWSGVFFLHINSQIQAINLQLVEFYILID